MERATISVILPNYNHAEYLPIALQAILDQTLPPTEVLVVDDCSTDESWDILNDFAGRYSNIKLFRNAQKMGVIYNLNLMLDRVSGDYLYTAASDDKVEPDLFKKSVEMLVEYPQAAFCSSECMEIDEKGDEQGILQTPLVPDRPSYVSPNEVRGLLQRMLEESSSMHWFHGPTVLQRSSVRLPLGPFDPRLHHFCDGFLYHLMALMSGCCYLPEVLACWRRAGANYSVVGHLDINRRMEVVKEAKQLMFQHGSLFPGDYIRDWEKRHICEARTFLARRFRDASTQVISDLANPVMSPGRLLKAGLWIWSFFVVCQTAALMFAASLTFRNARYWRKRVAPIAFSHIRTQMKRVWWGVCRATRVTARTLKRAFSGLRERGGRIR